MLKEGFYFVLGEIDSSTQCFTFIRFFHFRGAMLNGKEWLLLLFLVYI